MSITPGDDKLYYKEIKSYVRATKGIFQHPLHIRFEKLTDEFGPQSYQRVVEAAQVSAQRVSHQQREKLYSNLLIVKRAPKFVAHAPTEHKSYEDIRNANPGVFLPPFTVIEGRLYTLADLLDERCVLRCYCDAAGADRKATEEWTNDEVSRREYVFLLNQLLGSHLRRCGLAYTRDFKRNYFPRQNETDQQFKEDWYNVRTARSAPPRTVARYYK